MVMNLSPRDIDKRKGMLLMKRMSTVMVTPGCLSRNADGTGSTPEGKCGSVRQTGFPFNDPRLGP